MEINLSNQEALERIRAAWAVVLEALAEEEAAEGDCEVLEEVETQ